MSAPTGQFDVRFVSLRNNAWGHVWGDEAPEDTVVAIDRDAAVSAFGVGSLRFEPDQLVLAGRRTVRSRGAVLAAGVMAIAVGFLIAVMWQGERWPPLALAIVALLSVGGAFLLVRAKRVESFRWEVPWDDVSSFTEMEDKTLDWIVTIKGQNAGTLPFMVLGERRDELADLMIQLHASGSTKVQFREREVPAAAVVNTRRTR